MSTISVIIASAGIKTRATSIMKAIASLEKQKDIEITIIVVLNGPNVCHELRSALENNNNIIVKYQEEPSLPNAISYGRSCVTTEYFSFLDDDDLYISDTLHLRCQILDNDPEIDVVACNGYKDNGVKKALLFQTEISLCSNPMEALFENNWLASCGGTFRTKTVDHRYFKKHVKYFEWTMTAFLLSLNKNITYLHEPTFIINDTQGSLSASMGYLKANPAFLKSLLSYPVPKNIKKTISNRYVASLHSISTTYLQQKEYKKAWKYHIKSLCSLQGLKYLPYTRHLI